MGICFQRVWTSMAGTGTRGAWSVGVKLQHTCSPFYLKLHPLSDFSLGWRFTCHVPFGMLPPVQTHPLLNTREMKRETNIPATSGRVLRGSGGPPAPWAGWTVGGGCPPREGDGTPPQGRPAPRGAAQPAASPPGTCRACAMVSRAHRTGAARHPRPASLLRFCPAARSSWRCCYFTALF